MTSSRRTLLRSTARALTALPLAAWLPSLAQTTAAVPVKVSVISFGGGFNLPLWAARDQGFFTAQRLDVQHTITADSKQVFTGLMEGRYHIAITALDNILAY